MPVVILNLLRGDIGDNSLLFSKWSPTSMVIVTHFNSIVEDSDGTLISLDNSALDPMKHSTSSFKENFNPNNVDKYGGIALANGRSGRAGSENKVDKEGPVRINRKFNKTIKDRGDLFKYNRNASVSLSDSMNSMVELIFAQLSNKKGQGYANTKFPQIFYEYNRKFKHDIVSLFETRESLIDRKGEALGGLSSVVPTESLNKFSLNVKDWNKNVYSHIGTKKWGLLKEFSRVQKAQEWSNSNDLKYFMQSLMILKRIFEEIEHIVRQFIWGNFGAGRRLNALLDSSYEEILERVPSLSKVLIRGLKRICRIQWTICGSYYGLSRGIRGNLHIFQSSLWSVEENIKSSLSWAKQYARLPKAMPNIRQVWGSTYDKTGMRVDLKMDGSIKVDSSYATAGGVLRNDRGE
ncbi:hypothetical protein Gogos_017001 [Gossypium gossypioides]|uniref:Uncharacterized protein n=1 Tax=Gossypium gossypioides TaxID=34282 RepID=A0A7J9B9V7_GOSGO|nr:hypothetical protein [Gossypium gossypioides]